MGVNEIELQKTIHDNPEKNAEQRDRVDLIQENQGWKCWDQEESHNAPVQIGFGEILIRIAFFLVRTNWTFD